MFGSVLARLGNAELAGLIPRMANLEPCTDDAARVDRIRLLEALQAAAAAEQARVTAEFAASQRAAHRAAGVPDDRVGRGIAGQVALAKRTSPHRAQRYVGWSTVLTTELPHTFAALRAGRTTSWRAMLVARESIWLSRAGRQELDRRLAPRLEQLGDRAVEAEAKKLAYQLDREGYVERRAAAERDRRVTLRPAPEAMTRFTGLLPVAQGIAAYAALRREADALIAQGDGRSRGQIMVDTLVQRVTGQAAAADVAVEIGLVMTDRTLLQGGHEPAMLDGYGAIPAGIARDLITAPSDHTAIWLRRLYTEPGTGALMALDSKRRCFRPAQRRFVRYRDHFCRTPWCGAPIRHIDHVQPAEQRGPTDVDNGQGYCATCNHARQAPGWSARVLRHRGAHVVELATPTGHRYRSRAPDPPGAPGFNPRAA